MRVACIEGYTCTYVINGAGERERESEKERRERERREREREGSEKERGERATDTEATTLQHTMVGGTCLTRGVISQTKQTVWYVPFPCRN